MRKSRAVNRLVARALLRTNPTNVHPERDREIEEKYDRVRRRTWPSNGGNGRLIWFLGRSCTSREDFDLCISIRGKGYFGPAGTMHLFNGKGNRTRRRVSEVLDAELPYWLR